MNFTVGAMVTRFLAVRFPMTMGSVAFAMSLSSLHANFFDDYTMPAKKSIAH